MKIHYLGSGAAEGIPAVFCSCSVCTEARSLGGKDIRTRMQAVIDDSLLIDFSPDSLMHAQREALSLIEFSALIVTHSHQDHWYPEDLMFRKYPYTTGYTHPLQVFGNRAVEAKLNSLGYLTDALIQDSIQMNYLEPYKPIQIGRHEVTALHATHDKREACYIYVISDGEKTLLYGHDTGIFPQETFDYLEGTPIDCLSLDCTMGLLKDGKNHMGIEDNRELVSMLHAIGCVDDETKIVVGHFSHNGRVLHAQLEDLVSEDGFVVAYDGLSLSV